MNKASLILCFVMLAASSAMAGGDTATETVTEETRGNTIIKRDKEGNIRGVLVGDNFNFPKQETDVQLAEKAIETNDAATLQQLLQRGLDPNSTLSMFPKDSSEATLLYAAWCKPELMSILLESGADPNLTRSTVLGPHTFYGYLDALEAFSLQRKSSADAERYRENLLCIQKARETLNTNDNKMKGTTDGN